MPVLPRSLRWLLALTVIGLLTSLWLEWQHLQTYLWPNRSSVCDLNEVLDCTQVATSKWAVIGLPLPIWGTVGFAAMMAAAWRRSRLLVPLSLGSALASLALLALSLLQIGALCLFCELVHLLCFIIAILAWSNRHHLERAYLEAESLNWIVLLPGGIVLGCFLFLPKYWAAFSFRETPPFSAGKTAEGDHWIGSSSPTDTIEEYIDYNCPHCRVATSATLRHLHQADHLRIVRRIVTRRSCSAGGHACESARAAYCAGEQGKFWQADRWLFTKHEPRKRVKMEELARDLELGEGAFKACLESDAAKAFAERQHASSKARGISKTPSYFRGATEVSAPGGN